MSLISVHTSKVVRTSICGQSWPVSVKTVLSRPKAKTGSQHCSSAGACRPGLGLDQAGACDSVRLDAIECDETIKFLLLTFSFYHCLISLSKTGNTCKPILWTVDAFFNSLFIYVIGGQPRFSIITRLTSHVMCVLFLWLLCHVCGRPDVTKWIHSLPQTCGTEVILE